MLIDLVIHILTNAVAISSAGQIVPGFIVENNDFETLVTAGFVLGLINFFVKPILKLLSLPAILLTFGLFTIVINVAMLFLLDYALPAIQIEGFWAAFWAMLVMSAVNIFIGFFTKK
jgi:putative membrane protein